MKPIIQKAQPYDGDGYICFVPDGKEGLKGPTGYGPTPAEAYADWANPDRPVRTWGFVFHSDGRVTRQV